MQEVKQLSSLGKEDYWFRNKFIGSVKKELDFLMPCFKKSESILHLEDNWDDEGSKAYSFETWEASIKFVIEYATNLLNSHNIIIDCPKIYNAPNGSIDIFWEYDTYTFLININANGEDATFYADNSINTQRIRGEFQVNDFKNTLLPIAKQA